ncbi:hypothetical protein MTR67_023073 [Solanum verrucosum]|uniref:Reverse transcriptase/retrotransposon-derived protein RNase H-like domain-containing protein n=1 Tax=Solanum verrucosum TaxID=315347 RepID=A0AAF0QWG1_SOLVR|nr:hypothetical protein MTR67_023073 [Solanum verrucosum]
MPGKVLEALKSWEEAGVLEKDRGRWRLIPSSIWWAIWKERNSRGFSSISAPLMKLTQKVAKFQWIAACEDSFQELKDRLTSTPVLALPDGSEGYVVYCDASGVGLGCVLM